MDVMDKNGTTRVRKMASGWLGSAPEAGFISVSL
jgi:hypothetical protein